MHALIVDGAVAKYPYTIGNLRKDNPKTSFPKNPSDELLAEWGLERVAKVDRPKVDHTKNVTESQPTLVDGAWSQVWNVLDATVEEVANRTQQAADRARYTRNALLSDSDWTQVSDAPVDATTWAAYRQALRDITNHVNFPYLADEDWPVKPD